MKKLLYFFVSIMLLFPLPAMAAGNGEYPEIISEAAILMEAQSGAVLYQKNADIKMAPASLTKIATAIYAIEKGNLDDIVTVTKEATKVKGTRVYLVEGEQVTLKRLIQGMLINSGNDAALAIALYLDGNEKTFAKRMNQYLQETIGVDSTHFTNPHGLYDENHYTTARDLALITNYAMKNPVFREIFGTKELIWDGQEWKTTLITHHLLLKGDYLYEGITGGKTGFVNESKQTLATTAEQKQMKLTAIVLKADYKKQIYQDTQQLLDYGFQHYRIETIEKATVYETGGKKFIADKNIPIILPKDEHRESLSSDGALRLYNTRGELMQTVVLKEEMKPKPVAGLNETKNMETLHEYKSIIGSNNLLIVVLLAMTVLFFGAKKWMGRI